MIDGLIGRKLGMAQIFKEDRRVTPVTVIEAGPCFITQVKHADKDGYNAVQLGFGDVKKVNSPQKGHLKGIGMLRHLHEFRIADISSIDIGQKIDVSIFRPGDLVDVIGFSKGRGFAGGVKRHHFKGGPKTHGQSDRLRAPGSIGSTTSPGRVFKGLRMAGHMGNNRVTVKNLEVVRLDVERNLLFVQGGIPGSRNGVVKIKRSVHQPRESSES